MDATVTTCPWSRLIIDGRNSFNSQKCEKTLTSNVRRTSASVESRMLRPRQTPALLIKTVGGPISVRIEAAVLAISAGERRSTW